MPLQPKARGRLPVACLSAVLVVNLAGAVWGAPADVACVACHPAPGFKERLASGEPVNAAEELRHYMGSAHGDLACADCHPGAKLGPHATKPGSRQCGDCHRPEGAAHGYKTAPLVTQLHEGKVPQSPNCAVCHGHHGVGRPDDPSSPVYWSNVPRLCATCHVSATHAEAVPQVAGYFDSIHGRAAASGGHLRPAVCTDCHLLHKVEGHAAPASGQKTIVPARAARSTICGTCHASEAKLYQTSAHGQAVARGVTDAAVCTDCHNEHAISATSQAESPVAPGSVVGTCLSCHGNSSFVRLHKLPVSPSLAYPQSYHGMANKYGDVSVANCASCHGAHDILPARAPASRISPDHLAETCGKCHEGAGTTFPIGKVHVLPAASAETILFLLQALYVLLILGSLGGFVVYIGLDLFAHWRVKQAGVLEELEHRTLHLPRPPESALIRMFPAERLQHWLLLVSFFALAISGLVLLFPETIIGRIIVALCGGTTGRAIVHRVAAAIMLGDFLFQGIWLAVTPRGRSNLRRLLPGVGDVRDLVQTAALFLGLSRHRPTFGRYGFPEKFEFWALVWGTFVMGLTGLLLTYVNWTLSRLPSWVLDASTIVHKWEAILAVEAIIIWHLYHVVWKPGVFPGNRSWITGRISFEQLVHEHPHEYAEAMGWLPTDTPDTSEQAGRGPGAKAPEDAPGDGGERS